MNNRPHARTRHEDSFPVPAPSPVVVASLGPSTTSSVASPPSLSVAFPPPLALEVATLDNHSANPRTPLIASAHARSTPLFAYATVPTAPFAPFANEFNHFGGPSHPSAAHSASQK